MMGGARKPPGSGAAATADGWDGLAFASITEIGKLFRSGKLSPVELTELMLERIERFNPKVNAYLTVTAEVARAQAKRAEAELGGARSRKARKDRGALHGIPVSLKDNIYTAGIRTTAGSQILRDFVPTQDAAVVTRLKEAGAVLLGKTNMHEFAYGVTSNNPYYGAVRNPWDLERIAGGSSGGSAAALAAGLCFGSIGSDTGGSIRIPAALCGVVGLKPTLHGVDAGGVLPLSATLDCVGPLARSVEDTAVLFEGIREGGGARGSAAGGRRGGRKKFSNMRLGVTREFFFEVLADEVRKNFDATLGELRKLGAKIVDVSVPSLPATESAGNRIAWAEATFLHLQEGWITTRAAEYSEDVRRRVEAGTKVTAVDYFAALEERKKFIAELRSVMESAGVEALVAPTTVIAAPLIGEETIRIGAKEHATRALLLRTNRPANLAGVPAISVPSGFTKGGLPLGLQFIGTEGSEVTLLEMAGRFEAQVGISGRSPGF